MAIYSIWVLEYAYVPSAPAGGIVYGAHTDAPRKIPYGYVLIKGADTLAMVDVGYNHEAYGGAMAERFGVHGWQPASSVLAEAGVAPAEVSHIFLTHAHFDHAGNTEAFPNAIFYLQERELSKWLWAQSLDQKFRWLMAATDPSDIARIAALAANGKLVSIDGDREDVLPGIDIRAAHDTHTWGCQYITIRNDGQRESEDTWVLAGDLVYSYDNLRGLDPASPNYVPIGLAIESQCKLLFATDAMIQAAGGDYKRVIPVHEDRLSVAYPSRVTAAGLRIIEITLADGEKSLVA